MVEVDSDLPLPEAGAPSEVLARALDALKRGIAVVMATVVARRGSSPATPGQKLLLAADGCCIGTIGGGALEKSVLLKMRAMLAEIGAPEKVGEELGPRSSSFNLGASLGMCCGGGVDVLLEPLLPAQAILVVGAGHVASAVAPALQRLGFDVTVCDEREEWADPARLPGIRVVAGGYQEAARELPRQRTAVLIMTHDHGLDQTVAEWALREGFAFVGGIGSRAKKARIGARLTAKEFPAQTLERLHMPLGVDVGARTPEEIAVAVAAEMVAWRRATPARSVGKGQADRANQTGQADRAEEPIAASESSELFVVGLES
jgi:xanthine dehydrogenase accessory factor